MTGASTPQPPVEHRTPAPPEAAPETVSYEGGGIFAAGTPGPSEESAKPLAQKKGNDFGPNMAGPMSPMSPMSPMGPGSMIPMAAPGMPDVGAPPTHGGVLGQVEDKGTLGLTLVAVAGGTLVGAYYGGAYGALAGSLFGGAAVSTFRAMSHVKEGLPESDKEAAISGTYAVGATIVGGVIWAKLVQSRESTTRNPSRRKKKYDDNPDECDIRPVGP